MINNLIYFSSRYKKLTINSLIILLLFYFVTHSLYGERGIIAYLRLSQQIEKTSISLDNARLERLALEHKVNLLRSQSLDIDYLDEFARKNLSLADCNEEIFYIQDTE